MIPVFPYDIRKSKDGCGRELLLRLGGGNEAFIIHLSLEQARILAVEMRGLATDHCPQHHLALVIQGSADSPASTQIPEAFRKVIEGIDMFPYGDEANG